MTIKLDAATELAVQSVAKAQNTGVAEVVAMLLEHWVACGTEDAAGSGATAGATPAAHEVAVYGTYLHTRVSGVYDTATRSLQITGGPGAGTTHSSASAAAAAVVEAVNPKRVNSSKNGLLFWRLANGKDLRSLS